MGTEPRCGARCAGLPGILCVLGVVYMSSGIPVSGAESAKDYFRVESVVPDRALTEMLSVRSVGWLGSDVAHSIPVTDEMSIWLFGDTFIGEMVEGARDYQSAFINNTIGVQDRRLPPPLGMEFYWGRVGQPQSFFPHQPGTQGRYYWPTMGVALRGEVFIFCYSVSGFFRLHRTTMIRVHNPTNPPAWWQWEAYDFGIGGGSLHFHSALRVEEPYLYFLGTDRKWMGGSHTVLARARIDDLLAGRMGDCLEFWVQTESGPAWGAKPVRLIGLYSPGVTESHIQYVAEWGLYFATTYDAGTGVISLTASRALTGPWCEPIPVYQVPEHKMVSFPIISYAARPHPELSTSPGELVISYATNSPGGLGPLFTREGLTIYAPKVIRVQVRLGPGLDADQWMLYGGTPGQ